MSVDAHPDAVFLVKSIAGCNMSNTVVSILRVLVSIAIEMSKRMTRKFLSAKAIRSDSLQYTEGGQGMLLHGASALSSSLTRRNICRNQ